MLHLVTKWPTFERRGPKSVPAKSTRRSFPVISRVAVSTVANHVLASLNYIARLSSFPVPIGPTRRSADRVTRKPPVNMWPYRLPETGNRFAGKYRLRPSLLDSRRVNVKPIVANWRIKLPICRGEILVYFAARAHILLLYTCQVFDEL